MSVEIGAFSVFDTVAYSVHGLCVINRGFWLPLIGHRNSVCLHGNYDCSAAVPCSCAHYPGYDMIFFLICRSGGCCVSPGIY
jgi:hypothetical protein